MQHFWRTLVINLDRRSWFAGILVLLFTIVVVSQWQLTAGAQTGENSLTVIGEAVKISIPGPNKRPTPAAPGSLTDVSVGDLDNFAYLPAVSNHILGPEAKAVFDLVNAERAKKGCAPLRVNERLTTAAQGHSEDMAHNDFFSHTSSDGRSPWDRIRETGYTYSSAAENIAAGYSTPSSAVNGWMNSSGHRANILNCNLKETGVGYYFLQNDTGSVNYRHYWTQVFATPR